VYGGSSNYFGSTSNSVVQTVNKDATTTTLTGSPNPVALGQAVSFTITVTPNAPGSGIAGGTVTLRLPKATLGTVTLDGTGHATFTTSALPAGSNTITATYNGDGNYLTSAGTVVQTVGARAASTTSLRTSQNPAVFGAAVTFTATVTGAGSAPTGTVSFIDTKLTLATVTLNASGVATYTTSSLSIGTHNIHAQYNGSSQYNASSSNVVSQTVTASTRSTLVASQVAQTQQIGLVNPAPFTLIATTPSVPDAVPQSAGNAASANVRPSAGVIARAIADFSRANEASMMDTFETLNRSMVDLVFSDA
jgi:hypothetical protein